ncbi:thioredoxin-disulfide reductase [Lagierella sp.]|uniref:thioredoxin-disulfide reductase n=1 Tax=Lagierella sp. TaxID=2849657 RepID=UPI00262DA4F6|nr:thioredoxin-disulfide reductase [Lagierella sp.]
MDNIYDIIIVGGGPAGLSCGLYASRAKLKTLVLEKDSMGGQMFLTGSIENYPGSSEISTGMSLTNRFKEQAESFGCEIIKNKVAKLELNDKIKTVVCETETYKAKTVVIATGATRRKLGIPGEDEFSGKGVSYCATCDGSFFQGLEILVIGSGNSAFEEAIELTKFGKKVYLAHRKDLSKVTPVILERARKNEKIEFLPQEEIQEIKGDGLVKSVIFKNSESGQETEFCVKEGDPTFGVFVFIGSKPNSQFLGEFSGLENGYILTNREMETKVPGVFAAGDIRAKSVRQIVTAAADGAIAAISAEKYITENF